MESAAPECTDLKRVYEQCFNDWYTSRYLKGDRTDPCAELMRRYRACVEAKLQGEVDLAFVLEAHPPENPPPPPQQ